LLSIAAAEYDATYLQSNIAPTRIQTHCRILILLHECIPDLPDGVTYIVVKKDLVPFIQDESLESLLSPSSRPLEFTQVLTLNDRPLGTKIIPERRWKNKQNLI